MDAVLEAVREAGRAIEGVRRAGFAVEDKGGAGPVTDADRAADALLRERLLAIREVGWLSEETADDAARLARESLWVVDPLDGTKEFVKGLPEYVVAVAFVEHGQSQLAAVHNPSTGETFWAVRGGGAYQDGRRIRVSESARLLASRSEIRRGEFEPFAAWEVEPIGSIELKLAMVAAGRAGATLSRGPKHEWDVCAGALLVEEAGGMATDVFGGPLRYNQPFPKVRGVLAGAPGAHARALVKVRETGASERMAEMDGRETGNGKRER
jgi:myo-inositol-1(or 4)-monophosphatase